MSGVVVLAWVAGGALVSTSAFAVAVAFGRRARQRRDERDQRVLQMVREANHKADKLIVMHQGGGYPVSIERKRPQPIGSVGIRTTSYPSGATSREEGASIAWPTDAACSSDSGDSGGGGCD